MHPAILVDSLRKDYKTVTAVDGISFTVPQGSITALLGGNGAGKTTTISMLLGMLTPTSGRIEVLGHDMVKNRFDAAPFMNFSSPYVDLPRRLSVRQNLRVYARLYHVRNPEARIEELSADLQLGDFIDRPYGRLSAGQQTRVSLAKSLINRPRLLLLDEPTASLDPDTADRLREYIRSYCQREGATILLASHNMREVEKMCDQVLMMKKGRIVDSGAPQHLTQKYGQRDMEDVFLHLARRDEDAAEPEQKMEMVP